MTKTLVRALYPYTPTARNCIPLVEGEAYEVLHDSNGNDNWINVTDNRGQSGYVPKSYVQIMDSQSEPEEVNHLAQIADNSTQEEWMVGDKSRSESEAILKEDGTDGCFLVRNSEAGEGFTLSVYAQSKKLVGHYRISCNEEHKFFLTERQAFDSLAELVDFYKKIEAGLCTKLTVAPKNFKIYNEIQTNTEEHNYSVIIGEMYEKDALLVRATIGFEKTGDRTLSMEMGEACKVLKVMDYYWLHVKKNNGETGYIPKLNVEEVLKKDKPSEWFVGEMSGPEASKILREDGRDGAYLVRYSNSKKLHMLSLLSKSLGIKHYFIEHEQELWSVAPNKKFCSLAELISYHQHNCCGMTVRLKHVPDSICKVPDVWENRLWPIKAKDLVIDEGEPIAAGNFGTVHTGKLNDTKGTKIAVKIMKPGDEIAKEDFLAEAKLMTNIHHENLVQLHGLYHKDESIHIVMEYMSLGSLKDYLCKHRLRLGKEQELLLDMCIQISKGMEYLSSKNYIHRDLAARNCLLNENMTVKVCDFGLTRFVEDDEYTASEGKRLPVRWLAIETLEKLFYSSKSDVWSFGVVMWEVYTRGSTPYEDVKDSHLIHKKLAQGYRLNQPQDCLLKIYKIMSSCWEKEPSLRKTFQDISENLQQCKTP